MSKQPPRIVPLAWSIAWLEPERRYFFIGRDMTQRIALEQQLRQSQKLDAIGHLTGRKIEARPPYDVDFEAVLDAARTSHTMLEINSSPARRDLDDPHARAAAQAGVGIVINSDAHRTGGFEVVRYGIATARRAWLGPEAVLNTRPWAELSALRPRALVG